MNDFALPQPPPAAPAPGYMGQQPLGVPQQAPQQQPQPRGRPLDDPEAQARKVESNAEAARMGGVLPRRALESKIQIFEAKRGRIPPMGRPVCTVLVSEIENAKKSGEITGDDTEDYLRARLSDAVSKKPNANPDGLFICRTVDRKGTPIPQYPQFELSLVDEPSDGEDDEGEDDEGALDGGGDDPRYEFPGGHPVPPVGAPPAPALIHPAELEAGVRRDERQRSNELSTVVMTLMTQMQQQSQQAQANQTQMFIQMMQQQQNTAAQQPKLAETLAPLLTALSPILVKLLEPKPDTTKELLLPLVVQMMSKKEDPSVMHTMLAQMPTMMQSILQVQSQAAASTAETTSRVQSTIMDGMVKQVMDLSRELSTRNNEREPEKDTSGSAIAQIAAAVLPAIMAQQQQAPPAAAQAYVAPALPAPSTPVADPPPEQPAPRRAKRQAPPVPPTETPADPPANPPAAKPVERPRRRPIATPESLIRGCVGTVSMLHSGGIPAAQLWDASQWILTNAPAPMLEAIRSGERERVLQTGAKAVMADATLLTWISNEAHVEFLGKVLDDVRKLDAGQVTDAYKATRIAELLALRPDTPRTPPAPAAAPAAESPAPAADPPVQPPVPAAETPKD